MSPVNPGFSGCPLVPMACVSRMSHLTPRPSASSPMGLDALQKLMTMFFPLPSRFSNSPFCHPGTLLSSSPESSQLLPPKSVLRVSVAASPRGADFRHGVQLDALLSCRLSSCPLPWLHHLCPLQTHARGSPDHVDRSNLAPRAEGRDAWLIASGLRDFKKTWASLRILESTKTGVRPRNTLLQSFKK